LYEIQKCKTIVSEVNGCQEEGSGDGVDLTVMGCNRTEKPPPTKEMDKFTDSFSEMVI
jgi:hypothetical protein